MRLRLDQYRLIFPCDRCDYVYCLCHVTRDLVGSTYYQDSEAQKRAPLRWLTHKTNFYQRLFRVIAYDSQGIMKTKTSIHSCLIYFFIGYLSPAMNSLANGKIACKHHRRPLHRADCPNQLLLSQELYITLSSAPPNETFDRRNADPCELMDYLQYLN